MKVSCEIIRETFKEGVKNGFIYDSSTKSLKADFFLLKGNFIVSAEKPALGMVYKLQECQGEPVIKFSEIKAKQTIPGEKKLFRLMKSNKIVADLLIFTDELVDDSSKF